MSSSYSKSRNWAWFDRWEQRFLESESYPIAWDKMETDRFKPIIVWWSE